MDLSILPILACILAGVFAAAGAVLGLVHLAFVSRRAAGLSIVWTALPAAGLAVGAWVWLPLLSLIATIAPVGWLATPGWGDRTFTLAYLGTPILGLLAGLLVASFAARRLRPRHARGLGEGEDLWTPPTVEDITRIVEGGPSP